MKLPLKMGSKGDDVKELQKALGIPVDKEKTGYFGKLTKEAVIKFQKENGLKQDGVVGEGTWGLLTKPKLNIPGDIQLKIEEVKKLYPEITDKEVFKISNAETPNILSFTGMTNSLTYVEATSADPEAEEKLKNLISDLKRDIYNFDWNGINDIVYGFLTNDQIIKEYENFKNDPNNYFLSKNKNGVKDLTPDDGIITKDIKTSDILSILSLPGLSQNITGKAFDILSVDIVWWDNQLLKDTTKTSFENLLIPKQWLDANIQNYGFVRPYSDKPWHLYYVGIPKDETKTRSETIKIKYIESKKIIIEGEFEFDVRNIGLLDHTTKTEEESLGMFSLVGPGEIYEYIQDEEQILNNHDEDYFDLEQYRENNYSGSEESAYDYSVIQAIDPPVFSIPPGQEEDYLKYLNGSNSSYNAGTAYTDVPFWLYMNHQRGSEGARQLWKVSRGEMSKFGVPVSHFTKNWPGKWVAPNGVTKEEVPGLYSSNPRRLGEAFLSLQFSLYQKKFSDTVNKNWKPDSKAQPNQDKKVGAKTPSGEPMTYGYLYNQFAGAIHLLQKSNINRDLLNMRTLGIFGAIENGLNCSDNGGSFGSMFQIGSSYSHKLLYDTGNSYYTVGSSYKVNDFAYATYGGLSVYRMKELLVWYLPYLNDGFNWFRSKTGFRGQA